MIYSPQSLDCSIIAWPQDRSLDEQAEGPKIEIEAQKHFSAGQHTRERLPQGVSGNPGGRPISVQAVVALARENSEIAINALVEIATDPDQPGMARVAASNSLLDRGYGRPSQAVALGIGPLGEDSADGSALTALLMRARLENGPPDFIVAPNGQAAAVALPAAALLRR